jgi:hypothetical protein
VETTGEQKGESWPFVVVGLSLVLLLKGRSPSAFNNNNKFLVVSFGCCSVESGPRRVGHLSYRSWIPKQYVLCSRAKRFAGGDALKSSWRGRRNVSVGAILPSVDVSIGNHVGDHAAVIACDISPMWPWPGKKVPGPENAPKAAALTIGHRRKDRFHVLLHYPPAGCFLFFEPKVEHKTHDHEDGKYCPHSVTRRQ